MILEARDKLAGSSHKQYQIVYETIGEGNPVLLIPAFSTVSSRTEMKGIANLLATQYQVTVLDWLGFGEFQCPHFETISEIEDILVERFCVVSPMKDEVCKLTNYHLLKNTDCLHTL